MTKKQDQSIDLNCGVPVTKVIALVEQCQKEIAEFRAKQKPLNGDQILMAYGKLDYDYRSLMCFAEGVRWAEKMHGIGEGE